MVLGSASAAGLLAWAARRKFRLDALRRHHEVGTSVFLQLGVIYAVLLAFVFSEVWSEYNTAANAISQECGHLHGASILAEALPPDAHRAFGGQLRVYVEAVVAEEWPAMERGGDAVAARLAFTGMWRAVATDDVRANLGDPTRAQLMAELASAHQWRETRLFQMQLGVPGLVWVLLIGLATVLVGFLLCFGIEYVASQVAFTAIFAGAIALVLALVQCLDLPFQGALRLGPDEFRATLEKVIAEQGG